MNRKAQCDTDTATYIQGKPSFGLETRASSGSTDVLATPHIDEVVWNFERLYNTPNIKTVEVYITVDSGAEVERFRFYLPGICDTYVFKKRYLFSSGTTCFREMISEGILDA